jgi:hypothetical protein
VNALAAAEQKTPTNFVKKIGYDTLQTATNAVKKIAFAASELIPLSDVKLPADTINHTHRNFVKDARNAAPANTTLLVRLQLKMHFVNLRHKMVCAFGAQSLYPKVIRLIT